MRMTRNHRRLQPARLGAATVELALCLPLLLTLTLGICEIGQALKVEAILSESARKACVTASRPACSNADVIADALGILTANGIPTGQVTVKILVNDVEGNALTAPANAKLSVTVSIPVSQVNWTNTQKFMAAGAVLSQTMVMPKQG